MQTRLMLMRHGASLPMLLCLLAGAWSAPAAVAYSEISKVNASKPPAVREELGQPFISYLFPAGGQQGRTLEVTVVGTNLVATTNLQPTSADPGRDSDEEGPPQIRLSGQGVTARLLQATDLNTLRLVVSIAPDAEPGERELRLVTRRGASNRARFFVGLWPEANEVEPNNERPQAQRLPALPVVINGQLEVGDRDLFRFSATTGQVIVCEAQARALQPFLPAATPAWVDACLTVFDAAGKTLLSVDDYRFNPDPVLIFPVPKNGDYVVQIADVLYRGRADFVYRLALGARPHLSHIHPLGGPRGAETLVELRGTNLPAQRLPVVVPTDSPPVRQITVERDGLVSNPLPFAVGDLPEISETEPNNRLNQSNRVSVPTIINGRIQRPGDLDYFAFTAQAGQRLVLEVQARRLQSALDSVLTVFDPAGKELAENDDALDPSEWQATHQADSRLIQTLPAAGDYVVQLRDAQGKGGNDYAYRLMIAPPQPDFALRVTPDNPTAGPGDAAVLTVHALRKDGFDGEIQVAVSRLNPGYVVSDGLVASNVDETHLTITVPSDAPGGLVFPVVTGSAQVGPSRLVRQASAAQMIVQAPGLTHYVPTREFLLTITEPPPFTLAAVLPPNGVLPVPQASSNTLLTIRVTRREGANGSLVLSLVKPPPGLAARSITVAADKNEGTMTLLASTQAVAGLRHNLVFRGALRDGNGVIIRHAPAVPVKIVPPQP